MSKIAEKTDPKLWDKVKTKVTAEDQGGKPGQWSARKAQLATSEYKKEGGGYKGRKTADNHLQQWTEEDWGTKSGKASGTTGERYLPKEAREQLSAADYKRTTEKKRRDTQKGKQFSGQPKDVAKKTKPYRATGKDAAAGGHATKADLYKRAKERDIRTFAHDPRSTRKGTRLISSHGFGRGENSRSQNRLAEKEGHLAQQPGRDDLYPA